MTRINPEAQLAVKLYAHIRDKSHTNLYDNRSAQIAKVCQDAARLMSMARSLRRRYNDKLNRPMSIKELKALSRLEQALSVMIGQYGLQATVNDDARGYSVYIHFPDKASNSMGGEGWGI